MKLPNRTVIFSFAIYLFFSGNAFAYWQVNATWQINNGAMEYHGIGNSKGQALEAARQQCANANPLQQFKLFCLNAPTRTDYSQLPEGIYIRSCNGCRVVSNTLICKSCKPVMEERKLDLNACGDTSHIENCHGELTCGGGC